MISCAARWYFRFSLSLRDIEELMLERGVVVTCETIRCWCDKFGARFAQCAKTARRKPGSTWHLDELFVTLRDEPYLLWRAVDEHLRRSRCAGDEHAAVLKSVGEVKAAVAEGRAGAELARELGLHLFESFPGHADYLDSALAAWMTKRTLGGKPVVFRSSN
uniref:IS6 family transposase n=2 Tax=Paraburkholderia sprentiae TaxID=948107 RepID=A0A1I9YEJ4_9BURK